jgi:hypothetical protein
MKKVFTLVLIFSLLILRGDLSADVEGTEIVVQKRGGVKVRGELIGETIYFYGKSDTEIQDTLKRLRDMARVKDLQ